jgi:L-aspartate oxidase
MLKPIETDILIIGSGLAGSIAALTAADEGKQVIIITKTKDLKSGNSPHAQGGIVYSGVKDSPDKLKEDILKAGAGHCWEPAVDWISTKGPNLVKKILIDKLNIAFDSKTGKGIGLQLTSEAAHTSKRIIYCADKTGDVIQNTILQQLRENPNITIYTNQTAIDLLTLSHHSCNSKDIYKKPTCFGVMTMDNQSGRIIPIYAKKTILATGGLGQIFLHSTNPEESTGDGIAMAWRAGARCFNLQYIQFHPTALYCDMDRFLVSEAVRGEGGILITNKQEEFMSKYHPLENLAPRDIVARAIYQTMLDTGHPCVYLDITNKSSEWIKTRFPSIYENAMDRGFDMTKSPLPVVPAAHYCCGGVGVNLDGRTSLKRLYAVGEVACTGVHGANRLASTSLLEALVWGYYAGKDAAKTCEGEDYFPEIFPWIVENEMIDLALISQDWLTLKNTMWNYVGLIRSRQRLQRARTILRHLQTEIEDFYDQSKMSKEVIGLRNAVQTSIAIITASLESRESCGSHYLVDEN